MAKPDVYNFEISDQDFDDIVLTNSHKLPVFVLFLSPAIGSCISLENILIDYAHKFAGQFILARLDIDMYADAREKFNIQNVPTLMVFKDGEAVHEEVGVMTYESLAALFKQFGIYNLADELREQAKAKHSEGNTPEAVQLLSQAAKEDAGNVDIAMDMCQIFLDINMLAEAAELFTRLPDNIKEEKRPRFLIGQITFKKLALDTAGKATLSEKLASQPEDEDTLFDLAVCHIADQDYDTGMAHLFKLLQNNPNAKGGGAKELALATINMLETMMPEIANDFRRKMNNIIA